MGRIGYLNVLPIYHSLERGIVPNDFQFRYGPPAALNDMMHRGELDLSSCSSMEYARHADDYYLIPNIAIGSKGPVQSVLLLSRVPLERLQGTTILVSAQTHTSAALLRILMSERLRLDVSYRTGDATSELESGEHPQAILAIGDEALTLRTHPDYPVRLDLGEAWREWTGLPFIFGVWIASRSAYERDPEGITTAARLLLRGKDWGLRNLPQMCILAAQGGRMSNAQLRSYFAGLAYDLDPQSIEGLRLFLHHLERSGQISGAPELHFLPGLAQ